MLNPEEEAVEKEVNFTSDLIRFGVEPTLLIRTNKICQLWQNSDWVFQPPEGYSAPLSLNTGNIALMLELARLTKVGKNENMPKGYPDLVMSTLQEAIRITFSSRKDSRLGLKYDWPQRPSLELAIQLLKQHRAGSSQVNSISKSSSTRSRSASSTSSCSSGQSSLTSESSNSDEPQDESLSVAQIHFQSFQSSFQDSLLESGVSRRKQKKILDHLKAVGELLDEES